MNSDIALALLNRAGTGADLLTILDSIAEDMENEGIEDVAAHYDSLQTV